MMMDAWLPLLPFAAALAALGLSALLLVKDRVNVFYRRVAVVMAVAALGQLGNAPRRFFYGPGIENFDFALIKRVAFDKTRNLEIRIEAFNVFNRPQFYGAGAVDGNIVSPTFGEIEAAAAPRFIQLAAKFTF